jgi:pimeloyl-ACP methyl ester carboxylesterase
MENEKQCSITAVLAHAAWADGSSWSRVTADLEADGLQVVAAQIPLTSFSDDIATLKRVRRRQSGRVVLVGHSYGGAVATAAATDDPNVKGPSLHSSNCSRPRRDSRRDLRARSATREGACPTTG